MSRLFCQPINENTTKNIFFCPDFLRLLPQPPRKAARCLLHGILTKLQKGAPRSGGGEMDEGKMILMKIGELCKMEKTIFSTKVQIFLGLTEKLTCSDPFAFRCRSVAPRSILFPIPLRFVAVLLRFVAVWFHALQKCICVANFCLGGRGARIQSIFVPPSPQWWRAGGVSHRWLTPPARLYLIAIEIYLPSVSGGV